MFREGRKRNDYSNHHNRLNCSYQLDRLLPGEKGGNVMKKTEAKKVLNYLDKISDKLTTQEEFNEIAEIMKIIEKEIRI